MRRSLQSSLLVGLLIGSAALVALGSSVIYVTRRKLLYQEFDRRLYRDGRWVFWRSPRPLGGPESRPVSSFATGWRWPRSPGGAETRPASSRLRGWPWARPAGGAETRPASSPPMGWRRPYRPARPQTRPASSRPPAWRPPRGASTKPASTASVIDCYQIREEEPSRVLAAQPTDWTSEVQVPEGVKDEPVYFDLTLPDGRPGRALAMRITTFAPGAWDRRRPFRRPPRSRRLTVIAAANTVALRQELTRRAWVIGASALGGMAALALLVVGVVRHSLRPLRPLAEQIAGLGRDSLGHSVSTKRLPAEIVPVVERLNELLRRLDQAFRREQAFTANVAHELRTPLAGIRSTAEVALLRPRRPEEYQQALSRALAMIVGLQDLVEKLLHLSRIEAGQVVPKLEAIRLRDAVQRWWQDLCEQAEERGLAFRNGLSGDLQCQADLLLLETILSNVLANAVQYADAGGTITVTGGEADGQLVLSVTNPASGLSEDDVDKVLDRFWRKEAARSSTGLHFGLGLSLVQRCAQVHGGSVAASLAKPNLFTLRVSLPRGGQA